MEKKPSKNENKQKLTILIDKDLKIEMKKEVLDLGCSVGELIEKLYIDYTVNKK